MFFVELEWYSGSQHFTFGGNMSLLQVNDFTVLIENKN